MSGLSSRVMNMKFMKKSSSTTVDEETSSSHVRDTSEWSLPKHIIRNAKRTENVPQSVGYGEINLQKPSNSPHSLEKDNGNRRIGRKVFGTESETDERVTSIESNRIPLKDTHDASLSSNVENNEGKLSIKSKKRSIEKDETKAKSKKKSRRNKKL